MKYIKLYEDINFYDIDYEEEPDSWNELLNEIELLKNKKINLIIVKTNLYNLKRIINEIIPKNDKNNYLFDFFNNGSKNIYIYIEYKTLTYSNLSYMPDNEKSIKFNNKSYPNIKIIDLT